MKKNNNLYSKITSFDNILLAWRKARKGKTKKHYVIEFEKNTIKNLLDLHNELKSQTYSPKPLETFILRDPKTRKISKSDFRDRIVHHAIVNILEPIFDKTFIYDSYANRKTKGTLKAIQRFNYFIRKVSGNGEVEPNNFNDNNYIKGYCLKADIKHYFQEVNHKILLQIIQRKITDSKVIWLIKQILANTTSRIRWGGERHESIVKKGAVHTGTSVSLHGMPLGNLTSQFFANVYLNELDYFVKHNLKVKFYIRYVDDFVILHYSKRKIKNLQLKISQFLYKELKLELHPQKSKIISFSSGIDFLGFRNFHYFKLLRKRNIIKMKNKIILSKDRKISLKKLIDIYQGWKAYAIWANTNELRENIKEEIIEVILNKIEFN